MSAKTKLIMKESAMMQESAVQFATNSRIHVGLAVKSLEESVAFYRILLGQEPTKIRPQYAKFEVAEPPLNLSLNESGGATGPNNPVAHFGIQVKSTVAVKEAADRLAQAGVVTAAQDNVTCCYAVQNKIWATDPDGNRWEVYLVLDNEPAHPKTSPRDCCAVECCQDTGTIQQGDLSSASSAVKQTDRPSACCSLLPVAT